eukprot:1024284-Pleurochrysis_carterae.AAC.1
MTESRARCRRALKRPYHGLLLPNARHAFCGKRANAHPIYFHPACILARQRRTTRTNARGDNAPTARVRADWAARFATTFATCSRAPCRSWPALLRPRPARRTTSPRG